MDSKGAQVTQTLTADRARYSLLFMLCAANPTPVRLGLRGAALSEASGRVDTDLREWELDRAGRRVTCVHGGITAGQSAQGIQRWLLGDLIACPFIQNVGHSLTRRPARRLRPFYSDRIGA